MRITILLIFFAALNSAQAADSVLSAFKLESPDLNTLVAVSKFFNVERPHGQSFEVIAPEAEASLLLALAPSAKLVERDTAAAAQARLKLFSSFKTFDGQTGYHNFADVQSWMHGIEAEHGDIASVVEYGKSGQGKPLTALRLTQGSGHKPVLMITAATHGDELITTEVLMALVQKLVDGYGNNERLSQIIKRHDIYFVPVLNPDGFVQTRRYDGPADPNRSYPFPDNLDAKPTPSIAGIIHLFETIHPEGSIDFHAFGGLIMYPWAYTYDPVEESARQKFDRLTKSMAQTNNYTYGPISRVIYVAPGSSADYYFWKSGSLSLGIEIGDTKIPNPALIPNYVSSQTESTWRFIESF